MGLLLLQAIGAGLVVMSGFGRREKLHAGTPIAQPPVEPPSETFGVSEEELGQTTTPDAAAERDHSESPDVAPKDIHPERSEGL